MPRHMAGATEQPAYRAVITVTYPEGRWGGKPSQPHVDTFVYGPYGSRGTAQSMITREINMRSRSSRYSPPVRSAPTIVGHVEVSQTKWERVQ